MVDNNVFLLVNISRLILFSVSFLSLLKDFTNVVKLGNRQSDVNDKKKLYQLNKTE